MHKTGGDKPPILPLEFYLIGIQDPFLVNIRAVPGKKTGCDGNN
jgi:hypothetical protein